MFVPKLIIHWPRFGPYHLARLNATHMRFQKQGFQILGLETAGQDSTYHWRKTAEAVPFKRVTLAENEIVENLGRRQLWSKLSNLLQQIQPDAVAISGYSAPDAQMLLLWCRVHQVPAILMSASKFDDAPRSLFRESVKSFLVRQYAAALCGGKPQRTYLEKLGMKPDRIFVGYDAVDNEYFYEKALEARKIVITITIFRG
ncbi:MAG: hypothetical protein IPM76_21580 [Chloroflexi bacterium]|nr:hypothetical protein [Chloroflexota bacterium]